MKLFLVLACVVLVLASKIASAATMTMDFFLADDCTGDPNFSEERVNFACTPSGPSTSFQYACTGVNSGYSTFQNNDCQGVPDTNLPLNTCTLSPFGPDIVFLSCELLK
jgi:hypothetical protein